MFNAIIDKRSSDRGLTTELWKDIEAMGNVDPRYGMFWIDDFQMGDSSVTADGVLRTNKGIYTVDETTSGTTGVDMSLGADGYLVTDPGATTAGQGHQIQGGPTVIPAAGKVIVFEGRLKTSIVDPQFFFGLCTHSLAAGSGAVTGGASVVVNTSNVLDAIAYTNIVSNDASASLYTYNDETGESAVQGSTAVGTLVAATNIKLGFRIYGTSKVEYYVDGVKVSTFTSAQGTIPTLALQPILVAQADGTQPVTTMDWWGVGVNPRGC